MADESEEACLVNPKSPISSHPPGGMPYTDGINLSAQSQISGPQSASSQHMQSSRQSHETGDQYDINDDIILSQFHADAIKQVRQGLVVICVVDLKFINFV